jgi:hypothetical protein
MVVGRSSFGLYLQTVVKLTLDLDILVALYNS